MDPEKLQRVWQSQSCEALGANPDVWLKFTRAFRRIDLWLDMVSIAVVLGVATWMLVTVVLRDVQRNWPELVYCASGAWVAGYTLFNRSRRRRDVSRFDETMLAHVELSIHTIEQQMRLNRTELWWYLLPLALGCMIPPVIYFVIDCAQQPLFDSLMSLLNAEAPFAACFVFMYLFGEILKRIVVKGQLRQLAALRALRESLLATNERST